MTRTVVHEVTARKKRKKNKEVENTFVAVLARILYCSKTLFTSSSLGILKRVMRSIGAIFVSVEWKDFEVKMEGFNSGSGFENDVRRGKAGMRGIGSFYIVDNNMAMRMLKDAGGSME